MLHRDFLALSLRTSSALFLTSRVSLFVTNLPILVGFSWKFRDSQLVSKMCMAIGSLLSQPCLRECSMCRFLGSMFVFSLFVVSAASSAHAAPIINSSAPVVVNAGDGHLQNYLDSLFSSGSVNVATGQSSYGSFRATANTTVTYLAAFAGYRGSNVLGASSSSETQVLFSGYHPGATTAIDFSLFGQQDISLFMQVYAANGNTSNMDYTLSTDNSQNPGGLPHALVFVGGGQTFHNLGDLAFNTNDIIVAFEDLNRTGSSDDDFNDLIVLIQNVQLGPVGVSVHSPEPTSLILWGLVGTCGGLATWRRARRAKK